MKKFFTKKNIAVIAVAAVLVLISIITLSLGKNGSDTVTKIENGITKPVKALVTSFVRSAEKVYGYMFRYDQLVDENERLKEKIAEMEQKYRDSSALAEENERLNELFKFSTKHTDYVYEPATIISWTGSNWASTFTIGKGSTSGIELGDSVINEYGYIVGQITELGDTTATVTTILDTSSSVGVLLYSSSEAAVANGDLKLMRQNMVKLAYLPDNASVATGDTVITSGKGGKFPQGLVMGYVEDVYNTVSGLASYASIRPATDFETLSHVYVITDFQMAD